MNMNEDEKIKMLMGIDNEIIKVFSRKRNQNLGSIIRRTNIKKNNKTPFTEQSDSQIDVAIITAVDDEYSAVLKSFPGTTKPNYENGASCFRQYIAGKEKKISVGLFQQDEMGMVYAAVLTSKIIYKYQPKLLVMCGVCAGIDKKKMNFGDLVSFSPVYDYRAGKFKNGIFAPAYKQREIDGNTKKVLDKMIHDSSLLNDIRTSVVCDKKPPEKLNAHICCSASGAAVLADKEHIQHLLDYQRNLSAIDMEAYAVAEAACLAGESRIPWLVVKGIQDFADSEKNDEYREYASCVSAEFVKKFIELYFE